MAPKSLSVWRPFGAEYALLPRWNRLQRSYIRLFGVVDLPSRMRARLVFRTLPRLHYRTVLDVGTGTGSYSFYLSRKSGIHVSAIDVDRRRVMDCMYLAERLARPNLQFMIGSADSDLRRFASESMDLVLAVEVLQYCRSPQSVFSELSRLLKPGGHLLVHVPARERLRPSEETLINDQNLRMFARDAGLRCCSLTPTFGGALGCLSRIFEKTCNSAVLTAMLYPFLLLASAPFSGKSGSGRYRLLVASKPWAGDEVKGLSIL